MLAKKNYKLVVSMFVGIVLLSKPLAAQMEGSVNDRVRALENYVETFQPTLVEFSSGFEKSITQYTHQLQVNLQNFSSNLEDKLDARLDRMDSKKAYIDLRAGSYQKVSTESGVFLIAVKKMTPIDEGMRLTIDVGNPNFADYKDFKLKMFWGNSPASGTEEEYIEWRQSLVGAEFAFQGRLEKGFWNEVEVDLTPADKSLGYLEVEMEVSSIELQNKVY